MTIITVTQISSMPSPFFKPNPPESLFRQRSKSANHLISYAVFFYVIIHNLNRNSEEKLIVQWMVAKLTGEIS